MRLFITGSSGFIGSNFVLKYNKSFSYICFFKRDDNLKERLEETKPDIILNCAAEIYDEKNMWSTNYLMVADIIQYLKRNPQAKFIQLGSSSEYGSVDRATKETDRLLPQGMYATTKAMASTLCTTEAADKNLKVVVVRPYSPYGVGEKPHRLFPKLLKAFKYDEPMDLTNGVHDFCYIHDFIDGLKLVVDRENEPGEVVNISSGVETTNKEVYHTFVDVTGEKNAPITFLDKFVTYPKWQANINHITNKYGWKCKYSLKEGIADFLRTNYYEST